MELLTTSIFSEVNTYFSISHKVDLKIRETLNEKIAHHLQLTFKEKEMDFINLITSTNRASTNRATINVQVKGPDFNRKEKIINWGLWLPYQDIVNYPDQRESYKILF